MFLHHVRLFAINVTDSWRKDAHGANAKPGGPHSKDGYACDFHGNSSQWFRFTGGAGNEMLNSCPKENSCGTAIPFWSDERMPKALAREATVTVYGASGDNCKKYVREVKVIRCSWDTSHDLIYKQTAKLDTDCKEAFCGME